MQLDVWNEDAIKARAARLAAQALDVWAAPVLAADVLDRLPAEGRVRPAATPSTIIRTCARGPMRELFEAFRKEVLALDPCVTEEFLKLYVAYKAETNFVDVVPQAKRLRLSLNMAFHEITTRRASART